MSGSSNSSNRQSGHPLQHFIGSPGPSVYRPTYEQLWRDHEQLQGTLRATRQQLERTQIELGEVINKSSHEQAQIARLQSKIREQEDLIQKQRTTISTQSKTISDPKNLKLSATPQKRSSHHNLLETPHSNQRHGIFDRAPPSCDVSGHLTPLHGFLGSSSQHHLQPYRPDLAPISPTRGSSLPGPPNGGIMMPEDYTTELSSGFQSLWLKAETFGHLYANVPDVQMDSRIDKKIKQVLMSVSDQSTASFLLNNASTRFLLVAKVINNLLTREVLKLNVLRGFNATADSEIGLIKRQIFPDTPPTVRCLFYTAIGNQIVEMKRKPGFDEFFQKRIHDNAINVWDSVRPLMHEPSENAWNDLVALVSDAHTLALKMFSGPHEFKYEYASTNDTFNPNFMVNRDTTIVGDPQMLMRNQYRVKLGINPTITFRDYASAVGDHKVIHYGGVLLRPPFKNSHA